MRIPIWRIAKLAGVEQLPSPAVRSRRRRPSLRPSADGPDAVLFTDDSPGHVAAARRVGMVSQHFVGVAELVHALEENGVPVDLSR